MLKILSIAGRLHRRKNTQNILAPDNRLKHAGWAKHPIICLSENIK